MSGLNFLSIGEAVSKIQEGSIEPGELLEACTRQIDRLNPELDVFITVQTLRGDSKAGLPLSGIPLAVKDLFDTKGVRTTGGTSFFKDHVPSEDAIAIQKLKTAGAIIVGKTNTHEIALGVTTVNPHYGACRNPWDIQRIPGGSSGGSAVAVATGMALGALGTDTGGSIRIPASLCGVVGLKATYGRVSLRGIFPLSWNLDHAGPLTRNVKDAGALVGVIAGHDPGDPYSMDRSVTDYLEGIDGGVQGWRAALGIGRYIEEADGEVLSAVEAAAGVLERCGARVDRVDMSFLRDAALANSLMTQADGAAFHRERLASHPEGFGADVRQRLETGRAFTSTEYALARKTQTEMKHRMGQFFSDYDLLLMPSTPISAPFIEGNDAVEQARRLTRFTAPFNLTGLPAISVPCGFDKDGLPIGLQIVSRAWNEAGVLRAARTYERETDWAERRPQIAD